METDEKLMTEMPDESEAITLAKALAGAVLGSLPAAFLWVVLGKAGVVAAICGFFMVLGEMSACAHFTKKSRDMNGWAALVICAAVMIINVYFCEKIIWCWDIYDAVNKYGEGEYQIGFIDCFRNFKEITASLEVQEQFASSLLQSFLFAAVGGACGFLKLVKK